MSNKSQKTAKFKDLRKILNYLSKKSKDIFQDSFIGFSNNLNDELLLALFGKETLTMIIDRGNPICKSFLYESKTYRFICLPILLVSEKILIHEI